MNIFWVKPKIASQRFSNFLTVSSIREIEVVNPKEMLQVFAFLFNGFAINAFERGGK